MGKKTSTPNNRPHFAWQEQVAARIDLEPAEKVVLWRLALHRNPNTGRCDPAISTLVTGTGVSERTVQRAQSPKQKSSDCLPSRTPQAVSTTSTTTTIFSLQRPQRVTPMTPVRVTRVTPLRVTRESGTGVTGVTQVLT
jgi:hypothetical protein